MALRIRPLSEGPTASGGLSVQPLEQLLASVAPSSAASTSTQAPTPEGSYADFKRLSPAQQQASLYGDVGGNSEGSIGASLGFGLNGGPTSADVAFSFGQLAGPSPLSAALNFSPLGTPTPAGLLSTMLSLAPAPPGVTSLIGMGARAAQQATINQAMQQQLALTALREGLAPMSWNFDPQAGVQAGVPGLTDTGIPGITGTPGFSDDPGAPGITGDPGDSGPGPSSGEGSAGDAGGPGAFHTGGSVGKGAPKGPERAATLKEGEFVVRKSAAQAHRPLLEAINRGEPPKKLRKLLEYLMEPAEEKAKA